RPRRGPGRAALRLAAEIDGPRGAAGQPDGAGDAVIVGRGMERAHDREPIGDGGDLREQLAEAHAGDAGGDGGEGAAEFARGVRLGVPGVELRRAAPEPKQHHRLRTAAAARAALLPRAQQVGERQSEGRTGADLQHLPPGETRTGALALLADGEHDRLPSRGRVTEPLYIAGISGEKEEAGALSGP